MNDSVNKWWHNETLKATQHHSTCRQVLITASGAGPCPSPWQPCFSISITAQLLRQAETVSDKVATYSQQFAHVSSSICQKRRHKVKMEPMVLLPQREAVRALTAARSFWEQSGEILRQDLNKQRRRRWPGWIGALQRAPWQNKAMRDHTLPSPDQPEKQFHNFHNQLQWGSVSKCINRFSGVIKCWRHFLYFIIKCRTFST